MKLFTTSKDNLDEVVFENRNKLYGAYAIRKEYDSNLTKAAASSFALLVFFVSSVYVASLFKTDVEPGTGGSLLPSVDGPTIIERPFEIVRDELVDAFTRTVSDNAPLEIVADHRVIERPEQPPERPAEVQGGGEQTGTGPEGGTPGPGIEGPGPVTMTQPIIEPETPIRNADVMPSFPGGVDEMRAFIMRNIHYPGNAVDIGIEGKVVLTFVVDKRGDVSDIQVIKSMGFGLDDEAVRVIQAMPRWTPGMQNGRLVSVQMILPVQFKLR